MLLLAVLLGGAVGLERELKGKAAGLRTNILICVGAALFTHLSVFTTAQGTLGDPSRIAAQIVTGVGFLGAGTILHARGSITGLTSAATIWLVAAIGVALGAGAMLEAVGATALLLLVLAGLGRIEGTLRRRAAVSQLMVEVENDPGQIAAIEETIREKGLLIDEVRTEPLDPDHVRVHLRVRGPEKLHDRARLSVLRKTSSFRVSLDE